MVPMEDVALYFAPIIVVVFIVWFLYKFIKGESTWQIKRREKKDLINKSN